MTTYGSGSIKETAPGSGKWKLRVYLGRDARTGNSRLRQVTFAGTEKQARKELARLTTEVADGKVTGTSATVGQLLDAWLKHIEPSRRPKTVHEYKAKIEKYIRPAIGKTRLSKLGPDTLDAWYGLPPV